MEPDFNLLWTEIPARARVRPHSVHGPDHWRRVERNGMLLARDNGADMDVVRLFALFHDSRRIHDGHDDGHGARGAQYARELHGELFHLHPDRLDLLCFACEWHTDRDYHNDPTVAACWDADRLDLDRVGITPNPTLLNTALAKQIAATGSVERRIRELLAAG
ncbi:MAG: hypothetical protein U1F77_11115 [Kiritimatiellia bacterium]